MITINRTHIEGRTGCELTISYNDRVHTVQALDISVDDGPMTGKLIGLYLQRFLDDAKL